MAGDVVERSRCEERDVGVQRRNFYPLAGDTVSLLSVLAMQVEAEGFSHAIPKPPDPNLPNPNSFLEALIPLTLILLILTAS